MRETPIQFRFASPAQATLAYETLLELGYRATCAAEQAEPEVALYVDHGDLTSALEIAQTSGGTLITTHNSTGDSSERNDESDGFGGAFDAGIHM